jgi:uncharacterized membrane protein
MNADASNTDARFGAAEIGALAHLYRGEMYRSKVWRTQLDATTNYAVVTTGIALSVAFGRADASPLPIVLVSVLVTYLGKLFIHPTPLETMDDLMGARGNRSLS